MIALAGLNHRAEPWQRAVVDQGPRIAQAAEPEPVKPKASFNPAWISAVAASLSFACAAGALVFSLSKASEDKLSKLDDKITGMGDRFTQRFNETDKRLIGIEKDVGLLQNWIRKHDKQFPGGEAQPSPRPEASQAPGRMAFAPSTHSVTPQVCIGRKTKSKFSCDQAGQCWDRTAFAPDFFKSFSEKAGTENILICDPK